MTAELQRRAARGLTDLEFAEFYRHRLVRTVGGRERSVEIMAAYAKWAVCRGAGGISFRMLRRFLSDRGHRPFTSNGAWYADLRIAADGETVVDPGPSRPMHAEYLDDLAARIDAISDSLERLRCLVSDAIEHSDFSSALPDVAAQHAPTAKQEGANGEH
ncbi:MAG: hypothetical protein B7Y47_02925 [Sphingomonas sp. 28-63-12]|nr:MAG: hypothetical protein B7Y47_02925 [Sphingomonas sp. 28-63-12]